MKTSINILNILSKGVNDHPKIKQWGWFILLWFFGLMIAMTIAYPIKFLMKFLG